MTYAINIFSISFFLVLNETPLSIAIQKGYTEIINILLLRNDVDVIVNILISIFLFLGFIFYYIKF